jgi:tetratricopeptide (TPR) repeat protein
MSFKKLENILLFVLLFVVSAVYLYTVAPTLSFWDCGEFIASAYTLAVPHPPGTPFYVLLGRAWLLIFSVIAAIIPISKEVAWHMNLLGLVFSVLTIFLLYKMILKMFRMFSSNKNHLVQIVVAFATCMAIAFYYTYWENAIETEVYAASSFVFVLINYLALLWYESVKKGELKNKYLLFAFYLIFLSTGVHLIPFLIFMPFYIFVFIIEIRYLKDILFMLLGLFQLVFFALTFLIPESMQIAVLVILGLILLLGIILPFNNPRKYHNWRFFWIGVLLVIIGISTELYLPIRAAKLTELYKDKAANQAYLAGENIAPRINECNPGKGFDSFNKVLHRVQYGPPKLIPRQTQEATRFNVITGYYWQVDLFVRYLSWQPIPENSNRFGRALVLGLFYLLGIIGAVTLFRRERKLFWFMIMIIVMLSFAMVGYLNLKFSPSDGNAQHQPREVRERDYFFHTGHVYFGILVGLGCLGVVEYVRTELKNNKFAEYGSLGAVVVFSLVPLVTNIRVNNRYGNFIPKDYGYNMLISCDDGAVVFTNGDNDTFPLWFAQEVLSLKRRVIVANLSLINTDWYIKQLKYWGVPISFSDYQIELLEPFITRDRRVIYVKDIMVRHILAANAGIKLKNEDYFTSQEEFAARYLKNYKGKRPVYFASTVSYDNYEGFRPYLRLEGLVYRVMPDSIDPVYHIDIPRTKNLFYKTYRYTGLFEPEEQPICAGILVDFQKRKEEGEFYDFQIQEDENTTRLYSNYAAGLHNLGVVLKDRGDIKGTIDAWRFALLFDPEPAYYFDYNLGLLYAQLGVADSADYYFSKITADDPQVLMQIGSIYRIMGDLSKALEYFQRALSLNPQLPHAYFGLYSIYLEQGDTTSAIRLLQEWLRLNPSDTSAVNMLKELTSQ